MFSHEAVHSGGTGETVQFVTELVGGCEITVNTGKAYVGHLIELAQLVHHQLTYIPGWNLSFAQVLQPALNRLNEVFNLFYRDRSLLACRIKPDLQLLASVWFPSAIPLDYYKTEGLNVFVGRESLVALETLPATADRGSSLT